MPYLGSTAHLRALAAATLRPEPPLPPTARAERVAIVSASIGAGHDGAAAELDRRLTANGLTVDRFDLLDLLPARLGPLVRDGYHRMLVRAPWAYERVYRSTERAGGGGPLARALLRTAEERMLRALHPGTGTVVSTYPGASRVLGGLRLRGRLTAPVLTYLTDFSVHPLWVADGVDVHLAAHTVPAAQARAAGARDVRVCGPVVNPRFRPAAAREREAARARFGLPERAPLALLVAGSWGVGPVRQVARELRECGAAVPVVVCGRNQTLAEQLRADGIEHAYGWVDDMPALMHAADVLVQNAGGLSSLEAFATGLPVASYRCIPGHGLTNAAALAEAGTAVWIRDPADLGSTLHNLIDGPLGTRQRTAALALFATGAEAGPTAEIARVHRLGLPPRPRRKPDSGSLTEIPRAHGTDVPPLPHPRPESDPLAEIPRAHHTDLPPFAGRGPAAEAVTQTGRAPRGRLPAGDGATETARAQRTEPPADKAVTTTGRVRRTGLAPRFRRVAARRLIATTVLACGVWACAVGTGIATAYEGPGVIHAIGQRLDLDRPGLNDTPRPIHAAHPKDASRPGHVLPPGDHQP